MGRKLLKTVQTITTFRNPLADPMGTRRGPPLVRGPQFENRCSVGLTTDCWRLSTFTVHELANAAGSSTGLPSDVTKSSVRTAKPARYTNQRRSFFSKKIGSTQLCIPPGSLNRVPASAGLRAGMSPLPGGR